MSDTPPIVVVGSGLAGYTTARELRKLDSTTPLIVVTGDDGWLYSKPMISNALGRGQAAMDLPTASAEKMASDLGASVLTRTRVSAIDPAAHRVRAGDTDIEYRDLVLALKHGDRLEVARLAGPWMARAAKPLLPHSWTGISRR